MLRPWTAPKLSELPKLTALTLASVIGGGGGTGGGGSTVFALLLAIGMLTACAGSEPTAPSGEPMPKTVASVACTASVSEQRVSCGGPQLAPGQEILGGQGTRVVLRSSNVLYAAGKFTFDVSVQNLSTQTIGTDGAISTGIFLFFEQMPVATSGTGTIAVDNANNDGTFTGTGQSYYTYTDSLHTLQISAAQGWQFDVPATVTTFTFSVLVAADVPEAGGLLRWEGVSGLARKEVQVVAASGPNDALGVGASGATSRFNGSTWTKLTQSTDDDIGTLAALGSRDYVGLGSSGKIWRNKNGVWTLVHERPDGEWLNAVWVRDANHFVAVGDGGSVTHYDNGTWTDEVVDAGFDLYYVSGTPDGSLLTVAAQGGANWTSTGGGAWVSDPSFSVSLALFDMQYDQVGHLFIDTFDGSRGYIVRDRTDTVFADAALIPVKIYPFDDDSLALQFVDLGAGQQVGVGKLTWGDAPIHGFTPTTVEAPVANQVGAVLDAAKTRFLVADQNSRDVWLLDPTSATNTQEFLGCGCFSGVWGIGDTAWVVDSSDHLRRIVDGAMSDQAGVLGAKMITGTSSTELVLAVDSSVYVGNPTDGWVEEAFFTDFGGVKAVSGIWADTASGRIIAIGSHGRWWSRDAGVWTFYGPDVTKVFTAVWGCSATEAWISGGDGSIFKVNGGTLAVDADFAAAGFPASDHKAITGTSCNDVWVGGTNGTLYHWDGAVWTNRSITGGSFFNIWALHSRGPGVVYAAGNNGEFAIVSADGTITRSVAPTEFEDFKALWVLENGEVITVDPKHVLRGLR